MCFEIESRRSYYVLMEDLRQSAISQRTVVSCVHSLRIGGMQETLRQMLSGLLSTFE